MKSHVVTFVFLAIVAIAGDSCSFGQQRGTQAARGAVGSVLRGPDALHQAAVISGGKYLGSTSTHTLVVYDDLDTLSAESDIVVVGVPKSHSTFLSKDGSSIQTRYVFGVTDIKQGTIASGDISVSIPGGRFDFDDGTSAEVLATDFPRLRHGATYVLYLKPYQGVFYPTGGFRAYSSFGATAPSYHSPIPEWTHSIRNRESDKPISWKKLRRNEGSRPLSNRVFIQPATERSVADSFRLTAPPRLHPPAVARSGAD
jgi:hypothetical protein